MKNNLLFLLLVCSSVGFTQDILWEKSFGGKQADYLTDAIPTADYGFILGGSSLTPNRDNPLSKGNYDYCIWKVNEDGEIEWQKSYGGNDNDLLYSIKATNDGGFILAGISNSPLGGQKKDNRIGQNDVWIIKLDARGNEMWQKTLGGLSEEQLASVIITKDNGYLIGASSESDFCKYKSSESNKNTIYKNEDSKGSLDYWLVKLNSKGELEWQKTIGGNYLDQLRSVVATFDGGYFVGGISNSNSNSFKSKDCKGQTDFWYMKLNSKGEQLWETTYGGIGDENLYTVLETKEHQLLVAGNSNSPTTPSGNTIEGSDYLLMKLDTDGTLLWEKTFSNGDEDVLTNVVQNDDESLLLCGYSPLISKVTTGKIGRKKGAEGLDDYLVLKTDKNGEELWKKTVGSNSKDVLSKAIETRDGGYLLAGTSSQILSSDGTSEGRGGKNSLGGLQGNNQKVQDATNEINNTINDTTNEINSTINKASNDVTNKAKETLGLTENTPLKLNSPQAKLGTPSMGDDSKGLLGNSQNQKSNLPKSRDKKVSYGGTDFWIVKLKDKNKPEKVKQTIEAFPNPSFGFTNIIVGYGYESGMATVVDLAGHVLQTFEIKDRTIPVDLSNYPEGIYIINIKTNVQSDGIKVIKGINKN